MKIVLKYRKKLMSINMKKISQSNLQYRILEKKSIMSFTLKMNIFQHKKLEFMEYFEYTLNNYFKYILFNLCQLRTFIVKFRAIIITLLFSWIILDIYNYSNAIIITQRIIMNVSNCRKLRRIYLSLIIWINTKFVWLILILITHFDYISLLLIESIQNLIIRFYNGLSECYYFMVQYFCLFYYPYSNASHIQLFLLMNRKIYLCIYIGTLPLYLY